MKKRCRFAVLAWTASLPMAVPRSQDPGTVPERADPAALRTAFAALAPARQLAVLARVDAAIAQSELPHLRRIAALAQEARDAAPLRRRTFHDPAVFAPVAPTRTVIPAGDPLNASVRSAFPPVRALRDLHPTVAYDWADGRAARQPAIPTPVQRFADLTAGYPPGADAAMAALLTQLDRDGDQRRVAHWCEQLYADRDGKVFEGITLYEAWYSGSTVEVPDVDAIAFARQVLGTQSFVSPIPDGARRDRLYGQIRAGIRKHREYRTLCEAAAAAFVTVTPGLDATYLPLVDRMHLLWGDCGHDVAAFAERLTAVDRSELIDELDRRVRDDEGASAVIDASKESMRTVAAAVLAACAAALAAERAN